MSIKDYQLLVVAHPDDEAIFFASLLLSKRDLPWKVVCVTDGNADGTGEERHRQWLDSMATFAISDHEHWDFPDIYSHRLSIPRLIAKLHGLMPPSVVFTHGIVGEYGHPHHQDVSYASHVAFHSCCPVYSNSYNCFSDLGFNLTREHFATKLSVLWNIYQADFSRFANKLPATEFEGFHLVNIAEVTAIYHFLTGQSELAEGDLKNYRHMHRHIVDVLGQPLSRPF